MQLNTEKTQEDLDLEIFEEVTNGMADYIVQNYGNLIKQNLIVFSLTEFIRKRKEEIDNSIMTEIPPSPLDSMLLGFCIEKLENFIKTKRLYATIGNTTLLSLAIILYDIKSIKKLLTTKMDFPHSEASFYLAIYKKGNIELVKLLLERESFKKILNSSKLTLSKPPFFQSLLYHVLNNKKFDIAKLFISNGAKFFPNESLELLTIKELIEQPDLLNDVLITYRVSIKECDFTPFTKFATNFEALRLLIMHGASLKEPFIPPFLQGLHITSSLKFGVYVGDLELCTQILEREKAPENIQEELYLAVFRNNPEVIKFLLQNCPLAQFDANLLLGKIIDLPLEKQHATIPVILENEHFNSNLTHDGFTYAFNKSLEKLKFGAATLLLKSNYFKYHGLTVSSNIFTSIQKIHSDHIDIFCAAIKDIIHQPLGDYDFFCYALSSKNIMLVKSLVKNGVDVNIVCKENLFPLLICAMWRIDSSIYQILLPETKNENIYRVLGFCIWRNYHEYILATVQTLGPEKLSEILDPNLMSLAVIRNNFSALDLLLHMYKDESLCRLTILDLAILLENKEIIQRCQQTSMKTNFLKDYSNDVPIFCGHRISEIPDQYLTFLRLCISSKPEDITQLRNIDISNINVNYQLPNTLLTPLMLATLYQNEEAIKFLLEKGANLDLTSQNQFKAAEFAVLTENRKIIELFSKDNSIKLQYNFVYDFFKIKCKRKLDSAEPHSVPFPENDGKKLCN